MEEWKEYKLGEVCSRLRSGKGIKADFISNTGKYPVIGGNGVRGYTDSYNFEGQAAVIGRQGAYCGNVRFYEGQAHMTEHAVVVVGNELADTFFLACVLSRMHLGNLSGQSAQPVISVQTLSKQTLRLPSIVYQKQVSDIIKSLDDKIAVNKKICENLEAQAQVLFKHWFIDFAPFKDGNFCANREQNETCFNSAEVQPKITGKACKFVESELGLIPEGWRVGRLEEMASVVGSGGTPKSSVKEYYIGDILWYGTGEFNDSFIYDSEKHISQEAIDNSSAKIFPIHTVLIAMYGATVGKLAILSNEASFNQAALGIVAADSIGYPFIYLTLLACRKQLIRLACGAAQQNLNAGTIKSHLTIIPNDNTMMLFNDLILPIFEKIECLQNESLRLATLRDTLLPKLMSGQIKVDEIEKSL